MGNKKKEELVKFDGWAEDRITSTKQYLRPDGTEDLEQRVDSISRVYVATWTRVEDNKIVLKAEIEDAKVARVEESYAVELRETTDMISLWFHSVTPTLEAAKSSAEMRAKKWIEQFPAYLLPKTE